MEFSIGESLLTAMLVFAVERYWSYLQINRKIQGCALLLYMEVNDHLYRLENIANLDFETHSTNEIFPDSEWSQARYFLATGISFNDFAAIMEHYRSMRAARKLWNTTEGNIPYEFLNRYIATAKAALTVLGKLAKITEEKVLEYNKLQHKQ